MKKLIIFIILIATYSSLAQDNKYIIRINNIVDLTQYKQPDYFFDVAKITNEESSSLKANSVDLFEMYNFLKVYKVKSLRKFIRRLPDELQTIKTINGTELPLAELQKTFIIETESELNENELQTLKENNTLIQDIDKLVPIETDAWPPNDPRYIYQPQFYSTTYNIDLPRAWNYSAGNSGIKIGIVDHGIDYYHEDLGEGFGQGYRIQGGYDFKDNDGNPKPEYSDETHGTPIAGIVGAVNWNGTGVIGIAGGSSSDISSGCQIFSFRVTSSGTSNGKRQLDRELIAEAVFEAATVPEINNGFGYGVQVINCSFGGDSPTYWSWSSLSAQSYYHSFWWAWANNVTVVAARGNVTTSDPNPTEIRYPADFSNGNALICVSGVNYAGNIDPGSKYGNNVTIASPYYLQETTHNNNSYDYFNGTSNATPIVAGVAALVRSKLREKGVLYPYSDDIREILKISTIPKNDPEKYGAGLVNAGQALYYTDKFLLTHAIASKNRTIVNVSNPHSNKITRYYPFGIYIVQETKKITATFEVPHAYSKDSTWVWANSGTNGVVWQNPSYGTTGASFVRKVGRDWTFETYCYKLRNLSGYGTFWYPYDPNQAQIKVSIFGKYTPVIAPVISSLTQSPEPICQGSSGYAYCNLSQGNGTLTYNWSASDLPAGAYITPMGNKCKVTYSTSVSATKANGSNQIMAPLAQIYCTVSNSAGSDNDSMTPSFSTNCGGCPTLAFEENGVIENENPILTKSVISQVDVTDYYLIQKEFNKTDKEIKFIIHEPEEEHTYLDQIELLEVKVNPNEYVAVTENGEVISYKLSKKGIEFINGNKDDLENTLSSIDDNVTDFSSGDSLIINSESLSPLANHRRQLKG